MTKQEAIKKLKKNINLNFSHAVLLKNDDEDYRVELHGGHAGNCCCCDHHDFVWRQESPYTNPIEIDELKI